MRVFLVVFLLILVLFEILILFPKKTDQDIAPSAAVAENTKAQDNAAAKNQVEQKMQGVHLVESQKGTRDWELFSKAAQSYQGRSEWDLEQVRILFYNNEVQDMEVRGDKGKIHYEKRDMKIEGHVEIETSNGYIFAAPYVEYRAHERLIVCQGVVQVKGPFENKKRSLFMQGTGMRIPVTERKMYLDQNVSGDKVFPEGKVLKFKSESAELSAASQTALLKSNVSIDYPPMKMKSRDAVFAYNDKTKQFEYLELQGQVELTDENRRAVSENLKVDFNLKQFTFSGQPRLYQGADELLGEQIIFMDNGKRVKVQKVRAKGTLDQ